MRVLFETDIDRLIKLLGMIGSEHVGKRAAAALKIYNYIRERGLTWHDVIKPPPAWQEMVDYCYRHRLLLPHEDHGFIIDANQWTREPNQRQLERLKNIYRKLRSGR